MSHEIRTPLHNVVVLADMLYGDAAPRQRARLDDLRASAEHLMLLINGVLDLSLIEADRFALDQGDFALPPVLDGALATVRGPAAAKGLALALDAATLPAAAVLRGDALRLRQVLINLLGNAVKFTERGAVTLRVTPLADDGASLRLRFQVEDSGPGIDAADCARRLGALDPAIEPSSRSSGGSGLGLAISARLVRAMGGSIEVETRAGAGTTFTFDLTFPRGSEVPESTEERAPASARFVGSRVLVAEDHPLSRELMRSMLAERGCTVDVAEDGVAAVERARSTAYDLILMDLQMPRMDGLAATRAIRALPEHAHTPILGVTSSAFAEDRRRCLAAGMTEHVGKPVTPEILARVLAKWLAQSGDDEDGREPPCDAGGMGGSAGMSPAAGKAMLAGDFGHELQRTDVVAEFARLHREDMKRVDALRREGRIGEAWQRAHALEGAAAMVGADDVRKAAVRLSDALRAEADDATSAALIATCEAAIARFVGIEPEQPNPPD